jgi:putative hydrolase of the HAD superfamily
MLECILFDLDNTLYPRELGIFDRVVARIRNYMTDRMGFEEGLARELRQEYVRKYGSTLRGLMIHQNVDPDEYLGYVHDVGVEAMLSPSRPLQELLQCIPLSKVLFTSSHRPHAVRVLQCLGVEHHFPSIFDITLTRYIPKPNPEPYHQVLETLRLAGEKCMMIEDVPANLQPAKELGMTTVLVGASSGAVDGFVDYAIEDILELRKVLINMEISSERGGKAGRL